jgi:hypothetical protein
VSSCSKLLAVGVAVHGSKSAGASFNSRTAGSRSLQVDKLSATTKMLACKRLIAVLLTLNLRQWQGNFCIRMTGSHACWQGRKVMLTLWNAVKLQTAAALSRFLVLLP